VQWSYPRVPFHGIFCSGLTSPNNCPATMGTATEADGGAPIVYYTIEWSRVADFCTIDGSINYDGGAYTYDIQDLTPGLRYYVRMYAANSLGRGPAQTGQGLLGTGDLSMVVA
jgi:hypothetical protein